MNRGTFYRTWTLKHFSRLPLLVWPFSYRCLILTIAVTSAIVNNWNVSSHYVKLSLIIKVTKLVNLHEGASKGLYTNLEQRVFYLFLVTKIHLSILYHEKHPSFVFILSMFLKNLLCLFESLCKSFRMQMLKQMILALNILLGLVHNWDQFTVFLLKIILDQFYLSPHTPHPTWNGVVLYKLQLTRFFVNHVVIS